MNWEEKWSAKLLLTGSTKFNQLSKVSALLIRRNDHGTGMALVRQNKMSVHLLRRVLAGGGRGLPRLRPRARRAQRHRLAQR